MITPNNLTVVANRLPVRRVERGGEAQWEISPGGLVSALNRVLQGQPAVWVGWTGVPGPAPEPFDHGGFRLVPVELSEHEVEEYYHNFSNRTIWPLYHDSLRPTEIHRRWWHEYVTVNQRFASRIAEVAPRGGTVWVHDYHLQLLPAMLRRLRPDVRITFFLHIPMPPSELFVQLPWRKQILEGMLGADRVGFQTSYGAQNFLRLARRLAGAEWYEGTVKYGDRRVIVGPNPISIDLPRFREIASRPDVQRAAQELRTTMGASRRIVLGVDRLDYTKGIDFRLRALETLLSRRPQLASELVFIQVAVPSRELVQDYEDMRTEIEQLVGRINGAFGEPGCVPVHYLHRNLGIEELVAYYVAADVMVVTPLRDGMNLVAKEYVACRQEDTGVLILSEFAGAAWELEKAIQVNPHDLDGLAMAFEEGLRLDPDNAADRMRSLKRAVEQNTVFDWADRCLDLERP